MEENAAIRTINSSIQALGRGFDVNFDSRLLYCKGINRSRFIHFDEEHTRDLLAFEGLIVHGVSRDVQFSQEGQSHQSTGVCTYNEMVTHFNRKALLSGNVPLGAFNSAFSFSGSKKVDSSLTKYLAMIGVFIPVCTIRLVKQPSPLKEDVKCEMPLTWDPPSLSSFIENYGTHIITSVTIGGKDVIYVKQHSLSPLSTIEIKKYVQDIGKQRFSDKQGHTNSGPVESKNKSVDTISFNGQGVYPHQPTAPYPNAKEDVTVIFRRRGGDDLIESHCHWAKTVSFAPDVIEMTFLPIASLLDGIPGKDHLIHAINLYLEYKPPIQELRYFLEFQIPRIWAPVRENRPGHQNKDSVCPYLQFSVMGQKLYISQEQVSTGRKPVSGLKLCLEGAEQNRLCIKVEHLTSLPKILRPYWDSHIAIGAPKWHGPEEQDSRWFEPVRWKKFSHVSTAPIDNCESFIGNDPSCMGVYIVTGAQLGVWNFGSKNVLYMKLLYSKIPGCTIRRSVWDHNPKKYSELAIRDDLGKILKMVDVSEMNMGPDDSPGHWLVTGGKLGVEKRKIVLRVKYSLLNY